MLERRLFAPVLVLVAVGSCFGPGAPPLLAKEAESAVKIGARLASSGSLRDLRGNRRPLDGFSGHKALVLAFLGVDCPVSNLYVPTLLQLEKRYRSRGVQLLAVYSNEHDDLDQVAMHASDHDLPFPVLRDFGHKLADRAGVSRLPTVVVLDGDFTVRYRGRIDDRYGVASRRPKATRADLAEAIDDVLAGKKVRVAETEPDGCPLESDRPRVSQKVTYCRDIAPILQKRCQSCHRDGQSAPFALASYDDAVKRAAAIKEVTVQRRMPPWHADPRFGHFINDRRLSRREIDTLAAWVDGGMARGRDRDLPAPINWPSGWVHGKPDMVFTMPESFEVPADGVLPYKNWILETHFDEDKWVTIAEARPGAASVVHHAVAYIQPPGQDQPISRDGNLAILVGWAPGDLGLVCPPDTALRIPRGSRLRLEMHYTPNGKAIKDRSSVGITFAKKPPKYELFLNDFTNMAIEVPPGDPHYRAEAAFRFRADARILGFTPHMHWRGKDYRYEVIYPDGKRETLLSVPRWDFNWQSVYRLAEPLKVPKGARLHAVAHWDNSANNPLNPDPSKTVRFGLQTWEEMMVGFVAYVWERPETAAELARHPPSPADMFFDRLDVNADDVLTADELPARLRPLIWASGVKLPQKITRADFARLVKEWEQRRRNRPGDKPAKKEEKKEATKNTNKVKDGK